MLSDASARFIQDAFPLQRVREFADHGGRVSPEYLRRSAELGWFAMLVPEEFGGGNISGKSEVDAALIGYQRGAVLQPGTFVAGNVVAWSLAQRGTDEHRTKVLPSIVAGETTATWACADVLGDWSGTAGVVAEHTAKGFRLSGTKSLVLDADMADWLLVSAQSPEGPIEALLPSTVAGVTVREKDGLDVTRVFSDVVFDDVEIRIDQLVGSAVREDLLEEQLQLACVLTIAESLGAMDYIFSQALAYAKDRIAFGRPIGSFQAVKHLLADSSLWLETSKGVGAAAAQAASVGATNAGETVSAAKAYIGDCGIELVQNCFQVFGGIGFTWEHDLHLYLRRLTVDASLYGDPAWHRERICAMSGL